MKIAAGSDHAGFPLKRELVAWLEEQGHQIDDLGPFDESSCDYPIYAQLVAGEVLSGNAERGLLVCGTGIGMALAANRFKGVRGGQLQRSFLRQVKPGAQQQQYPDPGGQGDRNRSGQSHNRNLAGNVL